MGSFKISRLPVLGPLMRGLFWEAPATLALLKSRSQGGPYKQRKQLLVAKLDAMGDFLLFLAAMREIRGVHPETDWEITLLGNRFWKELVTIIPVADRYCFVDLRLFEINPWYRLTTLSSIAAAGFDTAIQGVYSRSFYRDDVVMRAAGARNSIGYYGDTCNGPPVWWQRGNCYYTSLFRAEGAEGQAPQHMLQVHAEFTASLGGSGKVVLPELPAVQAAPQLKDPYCVIVPGGSARIRQWPSERFARLAEFIHARTGSRPIIMGGRKDGEVASRVMAAAPSLPWLDFSGKTSLLQALGVIANAAYYVGNDTGLTHMATMARVPTLALVGGAFPGRDFPYPEGIAPHLITVCNLPPCKGCGWQCGSLIDGRARCVQDISLEAVIASIPWF